MAANPCIASGIILSRKLIRSNSDSPNKGSIWKIMISSGIMDMKKKNAMLDAQVPTSLAVQSSAVFLTRCFAFILIPLVSSIFPFLLPAKPAAIF